MPHVVEVIVGTTGKNSAKFPSRPGSERRNGTSKACNPHQARFPAQRISIVIKKMRSVTRHNVQICSENFQLTQYPLPKSSTLRTVRLKDKVLSVKACFVFRNIQVAQREHLPVHANEQRCLTVSNAIPFHENCSEHQGEKSYFLSLSLGPAKHTGIYPTSKNQTHVTLCLRRATRMKRI